MMKLLIVFILFCSCGLNNKVEKNNNKLLVQLIAKKFSLITNIALMRCDFSISQKERERLLPMVGRKSTVRLSLNSDCKIDFKHGEQIAKDCSNNDIMGAGKITIIKNSLLFVKGIISSDASNKFMVIPQKKDSLSMQLNIVFEQFQLKESDDFDLIIKEGTSSFSAYPQLIKNTHLKQNASKIFGNNLVSLENIILNKISIELSDMRRSVVKNIISSNYSKTVHIKDVLYESYSGNVNIANKITSFSFQNYPKQHKILNNNYKELCVSYPQILFKLNGEKANYLQYLDNIAEKIIVPKISFILPRVLKSIVYFMQDYQGQSKNSGCGFSNQKTLSSEKINGNLGFSQAQSVMSINDCTLEFANYTAAPLVGKSGVFSQKMSAQDYFGVIPYIHGKINFSGKKIRVGSYVSHIGEKIIPTNMRPDVYLIEKLQLINFNYKEVCEQYSQQESCHISSAHCSCSLTKKEQDNLQIIFHKADIAAELQPLFAYDKDKLYCSQRSPLAKINNLILKNALISIKNRNDWYQVYINNGKIDYDDGDWYSDKSHVSSVISIDHRQIKFFSNLDKFGSQFSGANQVDNFLKYSEKSLKPPRGTMCSIEPMLGYYTSKILIDMIGKLNTSVIDKLTVNNQPKIVKFDDARGKELFIRNNISIGKKTKKQLLPGYCQKDEFLMEGQLGGSVKYELFGNLQEAVSIKDVLVDKLKLSNSNSLSRNNPYYGEITYNHTKLDDFSIQSVKNINEQYKLTVNRGFLSANIVPFFAESKNEECTFIHQTPIIKFNRVQLSDSDILLQVDNMHFNVQVLASNLFAKSGYYNNNGNYLHGTIKIKHKYSSDSTNDAVKYHEVKIKNHDDTLAVLNKNITRENFYLFEKDYMCNNDIRDPLRDDSLWKVRCD